MGSSGRALDFAQDKDFEVGRVQRGELRDSPANTGRYFIRNVDPIPRPGDAFEVNDEVQRRAASPPTGRFPTPFPLISLYRSPLTVCFHFTGFSTLCGRPRSRGGGFWALLMTPV